MSSYNLVDEKWIPCILPDGKTEDFGLQEVLVRAHEIKELMDPSPLVTVSLHRLLLAILHRKFGPSSLPKWQELWNKGKWDENVLKAYFSTWRVVNLLSISENGTLQNRTLLVLSGEGRKLSEGLIILSSV